MSNIELQHGIACGKPQKSLKRRVASAAKSTAKWTLLASAMAVVAVPIACYFGYEYARHGRKGIQRGCVRRYPARRYTPEEWAALTTPPRPDVIEVWEHREVETEEDRQRRIENELFGIEPEEAWRPEEGWAAFLTARHRRGFRFRDLPSEIQAMVLEYLVFDSAGKRWNACAGYNKDGFIFLSDYETAGENEDQVQRRFKRPDVPRKPLYAVPPEWERKKRRLKKNDEVDTGFAVWRTGSTSMVGSLLRVSRDMNAVTKKLLLSRFSGTVVFTGRPRNSLADSPWLWHGAGPSAHIVRRNWWVFENVRVMRTHHYWDAWPDLLKVMPRLERVVVDLLSRRWLRTSAMQGTLERYFNGPGLVEMDVQAECQAIGRAWVKWAQEADETEINGKKRIVDIAIRLNVPQSKADGSLDKLRRAEVELWPQAGQTRYLD